MTTPRTLWLERHRALVDDIRAALGWALTQRNDLRLAVRLASIAMPVGLQLGLVDEFRAIVEATIEVAPLLDPPEFVAEMRLLITNGFLSQNVRGPRGEQLPYLDRAIALAEQTGRDQYLIEPRLFFASFNLSIGDYAAAIVHAERAHALAEASGEDLALLGAKRMLAQVATFAGRHQQARVIARSVLAHPVVHIPYAYGNMQTDKRVSMRFVMARSLWLEGYADQARELVEEAVAIAPEDGPQALSHALALGACPVLLWRGDNARAAELTDRLLTHSSRFGMAHWQSWGELFGDVLSQRRGEWPVGEPLPAAGGLQQATLATFNGQPAAHTRVVASDWSAPELQRVLAAAQLRLGNREAGEAMLGDALALARSQGALAWELRAATSLMQLHAQTHGSSVARDRLAAVLDRFTEGRDTADLKTAMAWLKA